VLIIPGAEVDEARLAAICDRYGIAELKIFGSQARGTAQPGSDIDILYTLRPGPPDPVGAGNLCHQAILMNHASGTVAPLDPELIRAGDAIGQRAQRRGLVQGPVRPAGVAEVLVLAQHDHQMPLIPCQGLVWQLTPAAADPAFHDRIHPRRLDRSADNPDARRREHRVEGGGEAGVPVVHDELCRCPGVFQVHEQVPGLLHCLRRDRMPGGSEDLECGGCRAR
jgi:hypothetical protein